MSKSDSRSPLIVAHRGAPTFARENTIASLQKAIDLGADLIEFDVRRTLDGQLVIFHDPGIKTSLGMRQLSNLTFEELKQSAFLLGYEIPTLEQVVNHFSHQVKMLIELKELGCERETIELLHKANIIQDCIIQSFTAEIIQTIRAKYPGIKTGFLIGTIDSFRSALSLKPSYLGIRKHLIEPNRGLLTSYKTNGIKIAVWTVDGIELIERLMEDTLIDAIITNRTDRAVEIRDKTFKKI